MHFEDWLYISSLFSPYNNPLNVWSHSRGDKKKRILERLGHTVSERTRNKPKPWLQGQRPLYFIGENTELHSSNIGTECRSNMLEWSSANNAQVCTPCVDENSTAREGAAAVLLLCTHFASYVCICAISKVLLLIHLVIYT